MISTKGTLIATLAAGLFAAAVPTAGSAADSAAGKVHCEGVNSCKGTGACHSASNACARQNGCKGKGWVETSEKECKDKGGKVAK